MIALGFDVGVDNLVVEKLRRLRLARNAPVVVVEQRRRNAELALLIQNLDLHEIGELPRECLDALVEPCEVASICVRSSVFMLLLVNCVFNSFIAPAGSRNRRASGADAGLRPRAFEHDAIEDLDLIEPVALGLEELPPLVDGRLTTGSS
jgi:hypothetical protein